MSFDLKIAGGDISINPDGNINIVYGNKKLTQELAKIILTDLGENKFHPYYGCSVSQLDIGGIMDRNLQSSEMERSIKSSIQNLIILKSNQGFSQQLNPSELIASVDHVIVENDEVDPRVWIISIEVTTLALDEVSTALKVRI